MKSSEKKARLPIQETALELGILGWREENALAKSFARSASTEIEKLLAGLLAKAELVAQRYAQVKYVRVKEFKARQDVPASLKEKTYDPLYVKVRWRNGGIEIMWAMRYVNTKTKQAGYKNIRKGQGYRYNIKQLRAKTVEFMADEVEATEEVLAKFRRDAQDLTKLRRAITARLGGITDRLDEYLGVAGKKKGK